MKKESSASRLPKRHFISGETIHVLYPGLPLKGIPMQDGLYDTLFAFDLARELGLNRDTTSGDEALIESDKQPRSRPKAEINNPSTDMLVVSNKVYYSTRITSQRTGYSPDELLELTLLSDSGILYEYHELESGEDTMLFFDVESVKTYRPKRD